MHPESQKTLFDMFELTTRRVELVKKTFPFQNNQIDGCDAGSLRARSASWAWLAFLASIEMRYGGPDSCCWIASHASV